MPSLQTTLTTYRVNERNNNNNNNNNNNSNKKGSGYYSLTKNWYLQIK